MKDSLRQLASGLTSLRLTLFGLGLMMILIFAGTLAQVNLGTYAAQKKYFDSFWIYWPAGSGRGIPIFPGGLTVGGLLLVNLVAAHAARFSFSRKKLGLVLAHSGLAILILGQFLTQTLARESQMAIPEGATRDYSESARDTELVVVMTSGSAHDEVVSVPHALFSRPGRIVHPALPFALNVRRFYPNARLAMVSAGAAPSQATAGVGRRISVEEVPVTYAEDEANNVSALVEVEAGSRPLGTWLLSSALGSPQSLTHEGREYQLAIRPKRTYYPFSLTLEDFRHDRYPGTDIPRNFSSQVRLRHPEKGEDRGVLIYMNHPLRYEGKTFYQASFGEGDTLSVLQVVENPVWRVPYLACALVALGLAAHFLMHLAAFMKRRAA